MGASPAKNFTPSKHHQVHLGSAAASAYYFGGTPKTPHSTAKKKHHTPSMTYPSPGVVNEESRLDETADLAAADTSILSAGTSSSEGSDMLNKSVLSDTTELTASSFVLQATSRQRLLELSRSTPSAVAVESQNVASEEDLITFTPAQSSKTLGFTDKKEMVKPLYDASNRLSMGGDRGTSADTNEATPATTEKNHNMNPQVNHGAQERPSPSMRSRLSTSPNSIRKLTSSLRKARQENDEEKTLQSKRLSLGGSTSRRLSVGSDQQLATHRAAARRSSNGGASLILPPLTPASENNTTSHKASSGEREDVETVEASHQKESTAAIATENLDSLLDDLKQDSDLPTDQSASTNSRSSEQVQPGAASPSSTIASTFSAFHLPATPNLTPKVTFTQLEPSPGRTSNPAMYTLRQATPHPAHDATAESTVVHGDESFSSPTSTKADDESHFRLTPSSHKKLTPTKLSPAPRRIPNPESVDSPARNTRSGKKKAGQSPSTADSMEVDSQELNSANSLSGEKRDRDTLEEEVIDTVALSRRNAGRISDISMASSPGSRKRQMRRRSSISKFSATENVDDNESVHSSSTASIADLDVLIGSIETVKEMEASVDRGVGSRNVLPSPATIASVPRSILASANKRDVPGSHSRKSVAFGSPEAAEYHVGDPSMSLTPMPHSTAKAMFALPIPESSSSASSSEKSRTDAEESLMESGDDTVEIETDMSALLHNVAAMEDDVSTSNTTKYSDNQTLENDLAAAATKDDEGTETKEIKRTLEGLLTTNTSVSLPYSEADTLDLSRHDENETVELEPNMEALLAETFGSPTNESMLQSANKTATSPADSVEMADAESIASYTSRTEKNSSENSLDTSPQKLNFERNSSQPTMDTNSGHHAPSSESHFQRHAITGHQGDEEDNTIELEADLATLLATTDGGMSREAPKPVTLSEKYPKLESSLAPRTDRLSFGETMHSMTPHVTNRNTEIDIGDDIMSEIDVTKELESDMQSLIRATVGSNTPSASRRRSSHRFSLTPNSKLSLSVDGSITINGSTAIDVETEGHDAGNAEGAKSDVEGVSTNEIDEDEVLELNSTAIMEAAGLPEDSSAIRNENDSDTLANANRASKNFRNPLIADAMRGFVIAVCSEIERKAELSLDANSCFAAIADERPGQMLQLQRALKSQDGTKSIEALKGLAESVESFVDFEWKSWEAQVIDSLVKSMDTIVVDCEENDEALERSVTLADEALEAVSLMEGRAVRKARRRSMNRRKVRMNDGGSFFLFVQVVI